MTFYEVLEQALALLQRHKRISYRALKLQFSLLGDEALEALKDELIYQRVARDEDGKGMVWTGETLPACELAAPVTAPRAPSDVAMNTSSVQHVQPPSHPPPPVPSDMQTAKSGSARTLPKTEHRQLTVMFCDLADSTKLSQQLDPEDLREVIRAYQATAAEVIQQYEGHVAQYLGDGLLIYFGWPKAHEDDAQRSLYTGLEIVEAITTTLNPGLEADKGVQLTVRLGVHTGPVVVGVMGGGDRLESLATGETVNIAARLEGLAQPNTVVVSSVTERLVQGAFELEDLGQQVLKGVTEPMQIFRVLSPAEVRRDEDESMPDGGVFLVGRDEEVGLLLRRWEQAKEGLGQVVLISGEAGIGKSSLVASVRHHVAEEGSTRLTFRCSPYHTNSALYPVITHLEQVLGFERDDTSSTKLGKLEQALNTTSLPLEESVSLVATLLSVPMTDQYPAPNLSPERQRERMLDTLVGWLLEKAERQPVLAVWEDLHWADPSTLEMLGLMVDQTPTAMTLNVLTFRPEFTPPWSTRSHMIPLTLNRLERPQVEALISHLAGNKALPDEMVEHVVSKTDGVPLYVEELTKMLLESDLLREETGRYVLTGPLSTVAIPDTLQDSLMARLDQLNQAKEVAQLGAVLGREFDYKFIQAISSQDEESLQTNLGQLVEAELLYQRGRPPRARYIFKHALIQDAAYASLVRNTRQEYHQKIARVLEEQFTETIETQPELVAYHYTASGLNEQAVRYWYHAGQKDAQRSANMEAIGHLTRGLELLSTLPETVTNLEQELMFQAALGRPLIATKGWAAPETGHAYTRAWELCQQMEEASQLFPVLFGLCAFYVVRAESQTAFDIAEESLRLARRTSDPVALLVAHRSAGTALFNLGELVAAQEHLEQCLTLYDPQQHRGLAFLFGQDPRVTGLAILVWTLWIRGYPDRAVAKSDEMITFAQELSHPFSLAYALTFDGVLHQFRQEKQAVQVQSDAATTLATAQGFAQWVGLATLLQGWTLTREGQIDRGIVQMHQGLAAWRDTGSQVWYPWSLSLLAEAYGKIGQTEEGLNLLSEAIAFMDKTRHCYYEAEPYRLKGELLLTRSADNHAEAETAFHAALERARCRQAKSLELRAATSLARLWQSQGKGQEAYELLAPVYGWFTEGFDTADLQEAKALLDTLPE